MNSLVLGWLFNSCSPEIRARTSFFTSAHALWAELKVRYTRSDGPRVFHLEKALSNMKQGSQSIYAYYASFKTIWDGFIANRPVSKCTCGGSNELIVVQQIDVVI